MSSFSLLRYGKKALLRQAKMILLFHMLCFKGPINYVLDLGLGQQASSSCLGPTSAKRVLDSYTI